MMGSGGVMMGSRLVVSAEWVERMRQLVQAGILSVPAVSAAVRIHVGQMLMNEVLDIVAQRMKQYDVPMKFTSGRRR